MKGEATRSAGKPTPLFSTRGLSMLQSFIFRTAALAAFVSPLFVAPASAADGEVLITQAKALAGAVTPGDAPGFPVTITQSGSYKLASNLQAPAGKNGIDASAVEVTIDFNGFRLNGDKTGTVAAHGVFGSQRNLRLRNGTIRNFNGSGVLAGHGLIVTDMNISENSNAGVAVTGGAGYSRIANNTIMQNGNVGVYCGVACHVEGNNLSGNLVGVNLLTSGTVLGNTIMNNRAFGILPTAKVGIGNNTIMDNAVAQISGSYKTLFPNACAPQACP